MAISDLIAVISLSATILSLGIIIGERFSKNEKTTAINSSCY